MSGHLGIPAAAIAALNSTKSNQPLQIAMGVTLVGAVGFLLYKAHQITSLPTDAVDTATDALEDWGLKDTQAEKDTVEKGVQSNAWDVNFPTSPGALIFNQTEANEIVSIIYNAWGFFDDDEEAVYAAIKKIRSKHQVSRIARAYSQKYNADLLEVLKDKLSTSELAVVMNHVLQLPNYLYR